MAYSDRLKRKMPSGDQFCLIFFPDEDSYTVVNQSKIHEYDSGSYFIIINKKSYDVKVLVKGTRDYCEKKSEKFRLSGQIHTSCDESNKYQNMRSRSPSPNKKRSKSSADSPGNSPMSIFI